MKDTLSTLVPAALTVLFALGAGFHTAAYSSVWWVWLVLGLVVAVRGSTPLWAPFGDLLPQGLWPLVWAAAVASSVASDVPRAGSVGLTLAPLLVLAAGAVPSGDLRRRAVAGLNGALILLSSYALVELALRSAVDGLPQRAALPLGHHNLLALFLLPLVVLAFAEWRGSGTRLACAAWIVGTLALLASFSLSGIFGTLVGVAVVLYRTRGEEGSREGSARLLAGLLSACALAFLFAPRVGSILLGSDASAGARATYAKASWTGFLERPLLGHGPGAAGWLLPRFMTPRLGVNPAGEVVSDPHSLPLLVLFELGLLGALLFAGACGLLFARLLRSSETGALAGFAAFFAMASVSGWFGTPAVWMPLLLVLGTAVEPAERPGNGLSTSLAVLLCAALLWSPALAHRAFDRAVRPDTSDEAALAAMARSVALDPDFPLYRFWLGRWSGEVEELEPAVVEAQALFALDLAVRDAPGALPALRSACRIDPLAPWSQLLLSSREEGLRAVLLAARAVALDPRLLAWTEFDEANLREILASLESDLRLPPGWRESLLADGDRLLALPAEAPANPSVVAEVRMDESAEISVSLFAFRRRAMSDVVVEIALDARRLELIETPSVVTVAREVEAGFLDSALCSAPLE
ncbi:MAG: O-antigen ligase family protein [Acidobacteriota bacterium]